MEQVKIGKFIAECRKEKGFTQAQLAEKLSITDKAISKWETGKGMPDASIMLELCKELGINVNELLSGERLNGENYQEKASENIVSMVKVVDQNRRTKNKITIIFVTILAIFFTYRIVLGIYNTIEVGVEHNEKIMSCEITDNSINYKINGLSVIGTELEIINTESETLVFITNKILLANKIRSHYESWDSMTRLSNGENVRFSSSISIDKKDIPDCKDKIKVYHTNTSLKKIEKANDDELLQIINDSHLICESE